MSNKLAIGLSACLAGEKVRFDGSHRKDSALTQAMSKCFEFQTFCPEVAIGMGIPRQPIRLVNSSKGVQAIETRNNSIDVTEQLKSLAEKHRAWMEKLSGFVVKKGSPSCGMERVKVYENKNANPVGRGLFTEQLVASYPLLPVEEEGRLKNPDLLDSFIQRVYAYSRWTELKADGLSMFKIIHFHTQYKMVLLSRCQKNYRKLGRLVASIDKNDIDTSSNEYISMFMETLKKPATRGGHFNVLQHLQGFLKHQLPDDEKQNLIYIVEKYRSGELPLIAPLTLLNMYFNRHPHHFTDNSLYLKPYPIELGIYKKL